jgi:serine/threonine protein kinase
MATDSRQKAAARAAAPSPSERPWTSLRFTGSEEDLEPHLRYRPGGYHPVHLDDRLLEGRYRVLHKLGDGGFSTVWLCQDTQQPTPKYVALKILIASESVPGDLSRAAHLQAARSQS